MRILAISNNMPHEDDPVCGIFAARQFREMRRQGADLTVLCVNAYLPRFIARSRRYRFFRRRRLLPLDGIRQVLVHYLRPPGKYSLLLDSIIAARCAHRQISQLHRQGPFSVIYGRGFWLPADIGLRLGRRLGVPVAGMGTGSDVNVCPELGPIFYKRFARIARGLDLTLATGKGVAKRIESVTQGECRVIGGLVDLEVFRPAPTPAIIRKRLGLPLDRSIVLFAGHILESKGIFDLVQAFEQLASSSPQALLVICGDGEQAHRLAPWLQQCSLDDNVIVAGRIDPVQMPQWMQASDLFALPSHQEGMPNAVMEAMACGLPVIATRVGGLPDALSDTEGAILVEPRDVASLGRALHQVVNDTSLRTRMAKASRAKAECSFGITGNVELLMNCLRDTVRAQGKGR
jgi:glycosyltransferase involved in cell wall biosynthesis